MGESTPTLEDSLDLANNNSKATQWLRARRIDSLTKEEAKQNKGIIAPSATSPQLLN